jgi:cystathionine beta-lyase/cystathionine gamma-synthase
MYSATKFLGGHSDLLAGVLVAKDMETRKQVSSHKNGLISVI